MKHFLKLFHTLKYLKFKQFWFRFYYRYSSIKSRNRDIGATYDWQWSGPTFAGQSIFDDNTVKFLNQSHSIESTGVWNNAKFEKLWLYNLHYFDDLNAIEAEDRKAIHWHFIDRWIDENPFGEGNGWEPYTLSLRIINLIKWFSTKSKVEDRYLISLTAQVDALEQQVEYHILGNHVFANAKAFIFFGAFLKSPFAEKILQKGVRLLNDELDEQFLKDGAHFELSPMYHCILLWDLLELINLCENTGNELLKTNANKWNKVAQLALVWLKSMLHPDGEISFFNDAAIGIAPSPKLIFEFASTLGFVAPINKEKLLTNTASGYSRITQSNYTLIFDHANVGPDYLPGHAHADSLSFELSVGKQRLFVNSGTSLYGVSEERLRQRKTAAHNTVEVENEDSSEVWSGFRVARRAKSKVIKVIVNSDTIEIEASHDGYERLKKALLHKRNIKCDETSIVIQDELNLPLNAKYFLHLHPSIKIVEQSEFQLLLKMPSDELVNFTSSSEVKIQDTTWHPYFGVSIPTKKIIVEFNSGCLETQITLLEAPH